jgi:hypothetical protein
MDLYLQRPPVRGLVLATLLVVAASGSAQAACYGPQQQLPAKTVAQFTAKPEQLLSKYPNGGAQMVSMVRDLVASDPAMLPLVLDLSPIGNADQVNSIGAGVGQAALVCSRTDQTFTGEIQQMVAAINNQSLTLTFTAVLGDQQHAAAPGDRRGGGVQPAPAAIMGAVGPTPGTTGNVVALSPAPLSPPAGPGLTGSAVVALGPAPLSPPAGPGLTGSPVNSLTNPEGTTGATGLTGATFIGGIASDSVATSQLGTGLTGATALGTNTSAIGSTVTTGALGTSSTGALGTSSTGALGTSSTGALGTSSTGATATAGSGAGSGSQGTSSVLTAVNSTPSSFFTLSFNARGESIRTTNVSATSSSVSPSR